MSSTIKLEVFRYNPETGEDPVFQTYEVPCKKDWVILDALNYIKDEIDGTLTYRWSCRMGVCGSCGMMINGEPILTCATFLTSYLPGPIKIEPLDHFPVIKDLTIEMSDFVTKLKQVKPWIIRKEELDVSEGEYKQTPAQLSEYKQYSMCINCMLCYAACPVYGLEPTFIGPAAIAMGQRYNYDSRDEGSQEREKIISHEDGIWQCTFVGECSAVCPKKVDPAEAIQRYKVQSTNNWWKSFLMPFGKREE